jgi:hypothetical protein
MAVLWVSFRAARCKQSQLHVAHTLCDACLCTAAASGQSLAAPLLQHTWSTCSVGSDQQDVASHAAAAGSTGPQPLSSRASVVGSEGHGRPPLPPAQAAAAAAMQGDSAHSGCAFNGPAVEDAAPPAAAAAAAAAQGEGEGRWTVPLSSNLQHVDSSSTMTAPAAQLRWLSDRAYSMNGEPVPLLPPRALEEISAWLSQLSQPGTAASSIAGTALHVPIRESASAPSLLVAGQGAEAGDVGVVEQERGGLHRLWQQLDRQWLQPWFGGRHGHHSRHPHAS